MFRRLLIMVILLLLLPAANAKAAIANWSSTPSPVSWWSGGSSATKLEADITVEQDNTSGYYYYAVQSSFADSTVFYGGLQINGSSGTGLVVQRMAIFSIWNATSGTAGSGGWAVTFGGEGVGYSVRIPYAWTQGVTYTITYSLQSDNGIQKTWAAILTNQSTGGVTTIGTINVPSSRGNIAANTATFHEHFAGSTASCDALESSRVRFNNVKLGGASQSIYSSTAGTAGLCSNSGTANTASEAKSWFNAPPPITAAPAQPTPAPASSQPTASTNNTSVATTTPISTSPTVDETSKKSTSLAAIPISKVSAAKPPIIAKHIGLPKYATIALWIGLPIAAVALAFTYFRFMRTGWF